MFVNRLILKGLSATLLSAVFFLLISAKSLNGQSTMGVTGLLNSPTAHFSPDGTVKVGGNFLNSHLTPQYWDYNTFNYFVGITFFPFMEVAINNTALSFGNYKRRYNNVDRSISFRLRLLKERRWLPSIAVGSYDLLTSVGHKYLDKSSGNKFFGTHYIALSKEFAIGKSSLSLHSAFNILSTTNKEMEIPLSGGLAFSPSFLRQLSLIAEYDTRNFNLGGSVTIAKSLYLQLLVQQAKYISFGGYFLIPLIK